MDRPAHIAPDGPNNSAASRCEAEILHRRGRNGCTGNADPGRTGWLFSFPMRPPGPIPWMIRQGEGACRSVWPSETIASPHAMQLAHDFET
jgi:hypothetical protein